MSDDKNTVEVTESDLKMIVAALRTMRSDYCTTRDDENAYSDLIGRLEKQWPDTSKPVAANVYYASIGTVSHATLRSEDLIPAFANELTRHVINNEFCSDYTHGQHVRHIALVNRAKKLADYHSEESDFVLDDLTDALQEFAPPGCYFGSHPGDGSDFGFWLMEDDDAEMMAVEAADKAKAEERDMTSDDMRPIDKLGLGPTREAVFNPHTQMWDITVTPPPWSGFSPSTISITKEQFLAYRLWLETGVLIQNALPDLTDDEREVLISGISSDEFEGR